jgi:hypothetical protein
VLRRATQCCVKLLSAPSAPAHSLKNQPLLGRRYAGTPDTNLAIVIKIFWEQGCGALPIVENGRAIGMITDRDISIALGTRNAKAGETFVRDVALPKVLFCLPQLLFAGENPADELTYSDVVDTMKAIYEHPAASRVLAVAS